MSGVSVVRIGVSCRTGKNITLHIILDQLTMSSAKANEKRSQLLVKVRNTRVLTCVQNNQTTEMVNHYISVHNVMNQFSFKTDQFYL